MNDFYGHRGAATASVKVDGNLYCFGRVSTFEYKLVRVNEKDRFD